VTLWTCFCLFFITGIKAQQNVTGIPGVILPEDSLSHFSDYFTYNTYDLRHLPDTLDRYFNSHFYSGFKSLNAIKEWFNYIPTTFNLLCEKKNRLPYTGKIAYSDKKEFTYFNGLLSGLYYTFYDNGRVNYTSYHVDGLEFGLHTKYRQTGIISYLNTRFCNLNSGFSIEFHENGNKKAEGRYNTWGKYFIKDAKIGYWTEYYATGNRKSEGNWGILPGYASTFGDHPGRNVEIGVWKYYNKDGSIQQVKDYGERGCIRLEDYPPIPIITLPAGSDCIPGGNYFSVKTLPFDSISKDIPDILKTAGYYDIKNREIDCLYEKTTDIPFSGKLIIRHPNGKIHSESYYEKGVKSGISLTYYEDGNIQSASCYLGGFKYGIQTDYYRNKTLQALSCYDWGARQGAFIHFYPDYIMKERGELIRNPETGKSYQYGYSYEFHETGNKKAEGNWGVKKDSIKNTIINRKTGIWKLYNKNGILVKAEDLGNLF